jgi:Fe-S cluster assembly iron-binding protein IscA
MYTGQECNFKVCNHDDIKNVGDTDPSLALQQISQAIDEDEQVIDVKSFVQTNSACGLELVLEYENPNGEYVDISKSVLSDFVIFNQDTNQITIRKVSHSYLEGKIFDLKIVARTIIDKRVSIYKEFKLNYTPNCALEQVKQDAAKTLRSIKHKVNDPLQTI